MLQRATLRVSSDGLDLRLLRLARFLGLSHLTLGHRDSPRLEFRCPTAWRLCLKAQGAAVEAPERTPQHAYARSSILRGGKALPPLRAAPDKSTHRRHLK